MSWHFEGSENVITKFKSQGLYTIKINYWKASGCGFPPSLIPTLQNIGILHQKKKKKLRKHMRQSVRYFCHGLTNFGYFYTLPTIIRVCPFTRTWKKNKQLALLIRTCPFSIGQLQRSTHCKKNLACSQGVWFNYLTVGQKLLSKLGWNLLRLSYPVFGLWELFLVILGAY